MVNRTVIVSVGAALLVLGLAGLGLVQTGVIFPPAPVTAEKPPMLPAAVGPLSRDAANKPPKQLEPLPIPTATAPVPSVRKHPAQSAEVRKKVRVAHVERKAPRHDGALRAVRRFANEVHNEACASAPKKPGLDRAHWHAAIKAAPNHFAAGRSPYPLRPIVIRFTFNPARDRPFDVASLHLGDRVRVNIRQVGPVNRRVYFTFSRGLNSPRGAVLELRTMYPFERSVYFGGARGYYVIQVQIYPDNRWRIMPRSLV